MSSEELPPNQIPTRLFPRIGEREPEPFFALTWRLEVDGLVERPLTLDFDEFAALPHEDRTGGVHCVTRWTRPGTTFRGVPLGVLLDRAAPTDEARFVRFVSGRGHDTSLPLDVARAEVLIADGFEQDGALGPLSPEHGGPVRSVNLARYFYKSVKWLRRIELMAEDRLGFWERTAGYHNRADPWKEERYVVRDADPGGLRRLLAARDLAGRDLLGADLMGLDLSGFDLANANLRNASLRAVKLVGADLRGAHFCNCDMRAADLRSARLDRVDLDGADLRGADLRESTGAPGSIAVTQFAGDVDGPPPALVEGLDWRETPLDGVLPEQEAYLRRASVRLGTRRA